MLGLAEKKGGKLLVAASGGADSTCLLLMLQEEGARPAAVHCNHGLRGRASDADEGFVRRLCARHKIPLAVYRKKIGKGPGLEARARHWRLDCYFKAAKRFKAKRILLGHHAQDQAETLLLNLARGAGLSGAGGMREKSRIGTPRGVVSLERPLLERDPAELKAWLKSRGQGWREDKSNAKPVSRRNILRAKVLPVLEKMMPGSTLRLAAFARRAKESDDALDGFAFEALRKARSGRGWRIEEFRKAPGWLRRRMLMALDWTAGCDEASVRRAEALVEKGHGKADLRLNIFLEARRGLLFLRIQ